MNNSAFLCRPQSTKSACLSAALVWCASGIFAPSQAAVESADVSVNVIVNLSITSDTGLGLSFGDISAGATAGTIVLAATGSRTATGGASFNSSVGSSPAAFELQGESNATYSITLPGSVVLSSSAGSMIVDDFTSSPTPTGVLDGSGKQTLLVGATLNVGSNQTFGSYSGSMSITVLYN